MRSISLTIRLTLPGGNGTERTVELDLGVDPGRSARTSGPPEYCYPEEPMTYEVTAAKLVHGRKLREIDVGHIEDRLNDNALAENDLLQKIDKELSDRENDHFQALADEWEERRRGS